MLRIAGRVLLPLLLLANCGGVFAAGARPLVFGLFPNLSPRTLVATYQPMRDFLEAELGRPVELVTAANFDAFTRRMLAKEYDLMVAAPHLARLGQLDAGYHLLAHYGQPIQAWVVVAADSGLRDTRQLAGKRVAIPDKLAIMSSLGVAMLAKSGLQPELDYQMYEAKSHNNAALSVLNRQADAAVIGSIPFQLLAKEVQAQLRVIEQSKPIPSQYFAASGGLSSRERKQILQALLRFAGTAGGKNFLERYGMLDIVAAKPDELKEMDAQAKQVRQWLMETAAP